VFHTTRGTLIKVAGSMLAVMFGGDFPLIPEENGTYFFDRPRPTATPPPPPANPNPRGGGQVGVRDSRSASADSERSQSFPRGARRNGASPSIQWLHSGWGEVDG